MCKMYIHSIVMQYTGPTLAIGEIGNRIKNFLKEYLTMNSKFSKFTIDGSKRKNIYKSFYFILGIVNS